MEISLTLNNELVFDKEIKINKKQLTVILLLSMAVPTFKWYQLVAPQMSLTLFSQVYQLTQPVECFESMHYFLDVVPGAVLKGIKHLI